MNIGYYLIRTIGKKQYRLSGPFKHREQVNTNLNVDVSECPQEFIITRTHFYAREFDRIQTLATNDPLPKSWLGNKSDKFTHSMVDLFADHR